MSKWADESAKSGILCMNEKILIHKIPLLALSSAHLLKFLFFISILGGFIGIDFKCYHRIIEGCEALVEI